MDATGGKREWRKSHTIKSLRLDVEAAREGRTWLLLPEGFRDQEAGYSYPMLSRRDELQELASVYVPTAKLDSGCIYLRRAMGRLKKKERLIQSAHLDAAARYNQVRKAQSDLKKVMSEVKADAREEVEKVRKEATIAIASLSQLFDLGRDGIEKQMKAHLENQKFNGEKIDARAFRECFRMVTQAVKGLGLPSDQRASAEDAVNSEVAAAVRATQEALAMAPGKDDGVEH